MYATAMVRKLDNGFRGVIENESERGLFKKGDEIFNRQLHPFRKGTLMRVVINFSAKGRRMVKSVTLVDKEATPLEKSYKARMADMADMGVGVLTPLTARDYGYPVAGESTPSDKIFITGDSEPVATFDILSGTFTDEREMKKPVIKRNQGYFVNKEARLVFNTALGMSRNAPDKAVKVMMVGPSGYGKTTLPKLFALLSGKQFLRMNCATVRDPEEWFGYREAREGSTQFIRSTFAKALEAGDLVVVLDEFNRLEPWLHNTLFPLLDDDGCTVVHDEKFSIGPGVIVVGTINTGYRYTGTFELDEALLNRFEFVLEVGPMPFDDEVSVLIARTEIDKEGAEWIVKVAGILRQADIVCSTRTSLLVANMVVGGLFVREAFETAVVKRIPVDASGSALRKQVVDLINVQLGPFEERDLGADIFRLATDAKVVAQPKGIKVVLSKSSRMGGIGTLRAIQLLQRLDVVGGSLSLKRSKEIVDSLSQGTKIELELNTKPTNSDEFALVGISISLV